jgi:hypothetical protein
MLPINIQFVSYPMEENKLNIIKKILNKVSVVLARRQEANG